jgi:hypothetical protein
MNTQRHGSLIKALGSYGVSSNAPFDRTLGQLERARRMRLRQPVLHKLEVHHSVSLKGQLRECGIHVGDNLDRVLTTRTANPDSRMKREGFQLLKIESA